MPAVKTPANQRKTLVELCAMFAEVAKEDQVWDPARARPRNDVGRLQDEGKAPTTPPRHSVAAAFGADSLSSKAGWSALASPSPMQVEDQGGEAAGRGEAARAEVAAQPRMDIQRRGDLGGAFDAVDDE